VREGRPHETTTVIRAREGAGSCRPDRCEAPKHSSDSRNGAPAGISTLMPIALVASRTGEPGSHDPLLTTVGLAPPNTSRVIEDNEAGAASTAGSVVGNPRG